jgi:hypothetical protein
MDQPSRPLPSGPGRLSSGRETRSWSTGKFSARGEDRDHWLQRLRQDALGPTDWLPCSTCLRPIWAARHTMIKSISSRFSKANPNDLRAPPSLEGLKQPSAPALLHRQRSAGGQNTRPTTCTSEPHGARPAAVGHGPGTSRLPRHEHQATTRVRNNTTLVNIRTGKPTLAEGYAPRTNTAAGGGSGGGFTTVTTPRAIAPRSTPMSPSAYRLDISDMLGGRIQTIRSVVNGQERVHGFVAARLLSVPSAERTACR